MGNFKSLASGDCEDSGPEPLSYARRCAIMDMARRIADSMHREMKLTTREEVHVFRQTFDLLLGR